MFKPIVVAALTMGVNITGLQFSKQQPVQSNQCAQRVGESEYYLVMSTSYLYATIVNMNGAPQLNVVSRDDLIRVNGDHCFGKAWEEK